MPGRGGFRGGPERMDGGGQLPFEIDAALESEAAAYHAGNIADDEDEEDWMKELFPPTPMPVFQWRSPEERAEAALLRSARVASRKRLSRFGSGFYALVGDESLAARRTLADFDAFEDAETFGNRKRKRRGDEEWPLRGKGIEKESLPKELWIAVSDGEESRQYANIDLEKSARRRARKRRALLDGDDDQDGKVRNGDDDEDDVRDDDDEDGIEELKDDDFDEDDDDAGNDYNAEKYFDDGDGGDDDHGGDEGGDDY